jgi:hypothetical protein
MKKEARGGKNLARSYLRSVLEISPLGLFRFDQEFVQRINARNGVQRKNK